MSYCQGCADREARIAVLKATLDRELARAAVVKDEAETAASVIHRRELDGTISRKERLVLRRLREALYDPAPPAVAALLELAEAAEAMEESGITDQMTPDRDVLRFRAAAKRLKEVRGG